MNQTSVLRSLLLLATLAQCLPGQSSRPASRAAQHRGPAARTGAPQPGGAARDGRTQSPPVERDEAAREQQQRELVRRDRLGREISALFVKLGSRSKTTSREARDAIIEVCSRERIERLGYEAERAYAWYRQYWAERATALVDIRLQSNTLLGMETVPVSLGVGGTVNIQLPRTRSISIGTTVPIPLGGGR